MAYQTKHQRADWERLRTLIAQGSKPIIKSVYLDDLRRMIILLYHHFAGKIDETAYQVDFDSIDWTEDTGTLKKCIGALEISVFDTSHNMYHIEMSGTVPGKTAGRWLFYKNTVDLYDNDIWCDGIYDGATGYDQDQVIFHLGKLFKIKTGVYGTTNEPITVTKTTPNVQYSAVHADYELLAELVPCGYWDETNSRVQSKIHYDTWAKLEYAADDCVSWQGGWQALQAITQTSTPPHLWNKGGRTDITSTNDANYEAGDNWSDTAWPKGSLVLYTDGITAYEAVDDVPIGTAISNTAYWQRRADLDIEWEKLSSEYNISTDYFELSPNKNYIHDFSKNFLGIERYSDSQSTEEGSGSAVVECHPSLLFPTQVDPCEQYAWIVRAYKEAALTNLSGQTDPRFEKDGVFKYNFSSGVITNPSYLTAVFDANRWRSWLDTSQYPNKWTYYRQGGAADSYGLDIAGNQFCNFGGQILQNVPASLTEAGWLINPNNNGSLQSAINMILSDSSIRYPATAAFKTNWRKLYFDTTPTTSIGAIYYDSVNDVLKRCTATTPSYTYENVADDEIEYYDAYPSVSHACWGLNEAGIELFLTLLTRFDWVFQNSYNYIPAGICFEAEKTHNGDNGGTAPFPTVADILTDWNCSNTAGTWRKTHQHTLGRSKWMRSQEMDEPEHYKDTFAPDLADGRFTCLIGDSDGATGEGLEAEGRWFGGYTIDMPTIDYFDGKFEDITAVAETETGSQWYADIAYKKWTVVFDDGVTYWAKQDITDTTNAPASNSQFEPVKYSFYISGNRETNATESLNLKVGWMVHLFNMDGESYPAISESADDIKAPYILRVRYDSVNDRTYVTVSDTVFVGSSLSEAGYFSKIGWNREISLRHDGFAVDFNLDTNGSMEYQVYYKLNPQLLIDAYDLLNLAIYKQVTAPSKTEKRMQITSSYANSSGGSIDSAFGSALGLLSSQIGKVNDPDNWTSDNEAYIYGDIQYGWSTSEYSGSPKIDTDFGAGELWQYGVKSSNGGGNYYAYAFKVLNWDPPLKELPTKIWMTFTLQDVKMNASGSVPPDPQIYFTQSSGGMSTHLVASLSGNTKKYYNKGYAVVGGGWNIYRPENIWSQKYESITDYGGGDYGKSWTSFEQLGVYEFKVEDSPAMIQIDYEDVGEDFFVDNFVHIDVPRALVIDDKPPFPTPIHHWQPYAELRYVLPYDLENPEDVTAWTSGLSSGTGDKVYVLFNRFKQLFIAKNNIVNTTINPINNPDEWEWQQPYVELHIIAESCVCKDREDSNPVKYSLLCAEDSSLNTEYTSLRQKDVTFNQISIALGQIAESTTAADSSGKTKLYYSSGSFAANDVIENLGTLYYDGVTTVLSTGSDGGGTYIVADLPFNNAETFTDGCLIINRTQTYTESDFEAETLSDAETLLKDSTWALQARDSANDVQGVTDNFTDVGAYADLTPPADYTDFWDE